MTAATATRDRWTLEALKYYDGHKRAQRVRRAHLIPPDGTFPGRGVPTATCGQPWWESQNSPIEVLPFDQPLPDGLTWCPKCLGIALEQLGPVDQVAAIIAEAVAR